jgi:hypothetical protein
MEPVYIPRSMHEKAMQRALIQYRSPRNHALVEEALRLAHREDLIGYGPKCLIRSGKYGRADPLETDSSKPRKPSNGRVRRSGMKSKGAAGKEAQYKGAPSKPGGYRDARSAEAPYKGVRSKEVAPKVEKTKEAQSGGIQEKEKARFWRGPDNLLHKGKRKYRGGKKDK